MTGSSYAEICHALDLNISKSTMSGWFKYLVLPPEMQDLLKRKSLTNLSKAREKLAVQRVRRRQQTLEAIRVDNLGLLDQLTDPTSAKLALAMLFWAEGSKKEDSLTFGNSDPALIRMFLQLLRCCYKLDEDKFRCTVMCRADQDAAALQGFWSEVTSIPLHRFYKSSIDMRTVGKPTRKDNYKGVCRINYYSSTIGRELCQIPKLLFMGP